MHSRQETKQRVKNTSKKEVFSYALKNTISYTYVIN